MLEHNKSLFYHDRYVDSGFGQYTILIILHIFFFEI